MVTGGGGRGAGCDTELVVMVMVVFVVGGHHVGVVFVGQAGGVVGHYHHHPLAAAALFVAQEVGQLDELGTAPPADVLITGVLLVAAHTFHTSSAATVLEKCCQILFGSDMLWPLLFPTRHFVFFSNGTKIC